jgi:hypothetical protein
MITWVVVFWFLTIQDLENYIKHNPNCPSMSKLMLIILILQKYKDDPFSFIID